MSRGRWTEEYLAAFTKRGRAAQLAVNQAIATNTAGAGLPGVAPGVVGRRPAPAASKYRNDPVIVDNIRFDSTLEADRYLELKYLRKSGVVRFFLRQVAFHLPGRVCYRADFGVFYEPPPHIELVRVEFEDTKGFDKQEAINKRKQVLELYGVDIIVLRRDQVSRQVHP